MTKKMGGPPTTTSGVLIIAWLAAGACSATEIADGSAGDPPWGEGGAAGGVRTQDFGGAGFVGATVIASGPRGIGGRPAVGTGAQGGGDEVGGGGAGGEYPGLGVAGAAGSSGGEGTTGGSTGAEGGAPIDCEMTIHDLGFGGSDRVCAPLCNGVPTKLDTDPQNCGECGEHCEFGWYCDKGSCTSTASWCGPFDEHVMSCTRWHLCGPGTADCSPAPGCESRVDTPENCGACGVTGEAPANAEVDCTCFGPCTSRICQPGFANCELTTDDCETEQNEMESTCVPRAAASACWPEHVGWGTPIVTAADGSYFLVNTFNGVRDFDPSDGEDVRVATTDSVALFVSWFRADGTYGWTVTFEGLLHPSDLAVTPTGAIALLGSFGGSVDFDPGPSVQRIQSSEWTDSYLLELSSAGTLNWVRTWTHSSRFTAISLLSVDGLGRYYLTGADGEIDADPDAGVAPIGAENRWFQLSLEADGSFRWARLLPDLEDCRAGVSQTVVANNSLWSIMSGRCFVERNWAVILVRSDLGGTDTQEQTNILAAPEPVQLGNQDRYTVEASALVAGREGDLYIAGGYSGEVDFDPGTGTALRFASRASYLLALTSEGAFRWVTTWDDDFSAAALAPASDGGILALGGTRLMKLDRSGSPGFTLEANAQAIASTPTGFLIAGARTVPNCLSELSLVRYEASGTPGAP